MASGGSPSIPCPASPGQDTAGARVASAAVMQHDGGMLTADSTSDRGNRGVIFDGIEWDDANLEHATSRATSSEIEQAIWSAERMTRHRTEPDRVLIRSATDGGRRLVIVAQLVRGWVRPITAWEEE